MSMQTVVSDILWNLDIIGSISNHQTLLVDGDRLAFDTRYFQSIRRPFTGDSRTQILAAISKTFKVFEEVLHSYQCNSYISDNTTHIHQEQLEIADNILTNLNNLTSRQADVATGLSTLATFERYNDDSAFKIEMNRFSDHMKKLCRKCEILKDKMVQRMPATGSCCYKILPEHKGSNGLTRRYKNHHHPPRPSMMTPPPPPPPPPPMLSTTSPNASNSNAISSEAATPSPSVGSTRTDQNLTAFTMMQSRGIPLPFSHEKQEEENNEHEHEEDLE